MRRLLKYLFFAVAVSFGAWFAFSIGMGRFRLDSFLFVPIVFLPCIVVTYLILSLFLSFLRLTKKKALPIALVSSLVITFMLMWYLGVAMIGV